MILLCLSILRCSFWCFLLPELILISYIVVDMLPKGSEGSAVSNDDSPDMFADFTLQDEESPSVVKVQIEG
jgi:hypothetical protein